MFVIQKQIKNEVNKTFDLMQQQLINLIIVFIKLTEIAFAIDIISTKTNNTFTDFSIFILSTNITILFVEQLRYKNVKYFDFNYKQKKNIAKTKLFEHVSTISL